MKCAALGEVLDGTESPALFHDCSTTQGNSGSPIFSLASGRVAGIHRAGFFMYRNEAVDADQLRQFIQSAAPLRSAWLFALSSSRSKTIRRYRRRHRQESAGHAQGRPGLQEVARSTSGRRKTASRAIRSCFSAPNRRSQTAPAPARKDILKALLQLKQDGQNATDELYVFFSGHGFSFVQKPGSRADVLMSADFEVRVLSAIAV